MTLPPLAALRPADPRTDADLLDAFTAAGDEAAFAELLRRYGGLVWAVCRRLTRDRHAAEDAFQATFLVLVRRAGAVRRPTAASFLHGVARKVSARTRRRAGEPLPDVATDADPLAVAVRQEEAAILHAELGRLPAGVREVLLLCDLGGLSRADAAGRLGWSEGSVKGRLERGRKLLAGRLAKRGIAGGLVVAVAPPAELVASAGRSATAVWLGGPVPAGLAGLVRVGLPWGVGKVVAAGLLTAGLATALVVVAGPVNPPQPTPKPGSVAPLRKPAVDPATVRPVIREAEAAVESATGDDMARNRLLCELAELHRRAGDPEASAAALAKAKAVTIGMDDFRYHEWRRIAQGYARLGDADSGLALADGVPEGKNRPTRETILQEAADAASRADRPAVAARLIAAMNDPEARDWLTAEARVTAVVNKSRVDGPGAVAAALELADPADRIQALVGVEYLNLFPVDLGTSRLAMQSDGIAGVRLRAGDRPGAADSLAKAVVQLPAVTPRPQLDRRAQATAAVVGTAARLGDLVTCRTLDDAMPADKPVEKFANGWKPKVTASRAVAESLAGNDAAAVKLADAFPTVEEQSHILLAVAVAQHRAGRKDASTATFDRVFDLQKAQKRPDYHNLMFARGRVGDLAGLKKVLAVELDRAARQLNGTPDQPPTAEQVAWAANQSSQPENVAIWQAEHGDFAGAMATAQVYRVDEPTLKVLTRPMFAGVLKTVAERRTAAGQVDAVRKEAGAETDPLFRAHRLAGLAEGLLGRDW